MGKHLLCTDLVFKNEYLGSHPPPRWMGEALVCHSVWPLASSYIHSMVGNHGNIVFRFYFARKHRQYNVKFICVVNWDTPSLFYRSSVAFLCILYFQRLRPRHASHHRYTTHPDLGLSSSQILHFVCSAVSWLTYFVFKYHAKVNFGVL